MPHYLTTFYLIHAETPSQDNVWSATTVRIMVLGKAALEKLTHSFPQQTRHVLASLQAKCDEV
jgi:hypothetical protein